MKYKMVQWDRVTNIGTGNAVLTSEPRTTDMTW